MDVKIDASLDLLELLEFGDEASLHESLPQQLQAVDTRMEVFEKECCHVQDTTTKRRYVQESGPLRQADLVMQTHARESVVSDLLLGVWPQSATHLVVKILYGAGQTLLVAQV